jgi:hypothetical protein
VTPGAAAGADCAANVDCADGLVCACGTCAAPADPPQPLLCEGVAPDGCPLTPTPCVSSCIAGDVVGNATCSDGEERCETGVLASTCVCPFPPPSGWFCDDEVISCFDEATTVCGSSGCARCAAHLRDRVRQHRPRTPGVPAGAPRATDPPSLRDTAALIDEEDCGAASACRRAASTTATSSTSSAAPAASRRRQLSSATSASSTPPAPVSRPCRRCVSMSTPAPTSGSGAPPAISGRACGGARSASPPTSVAARARARGKGKGKARARANPECPGLAETCNGVARVPCWKACDPLDQPLQCSAQCAAGVWSCAGFADYIPANQCPP